MIKRPVQLQFLLILLTALIGVQIIYAQDEDVEIPETISLGLLKAVFEPVTFPHRDHAHMSEMGAGCITCHHYADEGLYDPCSDCHTNDPDDLDSGIPSLNAAYHRKCLSCHREWNGGNVCGTCHVKANSNLGNTVKAAEKTEHKISYPREVHFQTPFKDNTQVTFHHGEHVELFRIDCAMCHRDENCAVCHGRRVVPELLEDKTLPVRHFPCSQCHNTEQESGCDKCHTNTPPSGFSHAMTTFPLKKFHQERACTDCHDASTQVQKLDKTCTNCHENFELGSFEHEATGLILEYGHEDFDCYECHLDERFDLAPSCAECHDEDIQFPENLPGTRVE